MRGYPMALTRTEAGPDGNIKANGAWCSRSLECLKASGLLDAAYRGDPVRTAWCRRVLECAGRSGLLSKPDLLRSEGIDPIVLQSEARNLGARI